jgi:hypothetical protein
MKTDRRLLAERAPRKTAQGRRIRALYNSFIARLDADSADCVAMALTAAELTVAAENARAQLLAGDLTAEQPTVRLENSARRARDDLKALVQQPTPWWEQPRQEDANGEEQ